jgi:hypothetical protein
MNPDQDAEPDAVIQDFIQRHNLTIQTESQKPNSSSKTITVRSSTLIHDLKIDTSKQYISLFTYNPSASPLPFSSKRQSTLFYVAYLNEFLTLTSLDVDTSSGLYKLKSSQGYPKGMNFISVLDYFWKRHELEYPLLHSNIEEFISSCLTGDPDEQYHSKKFHSQLSSLKLN